MSWFQKSGGPREDLGTVLARCYHAAFSSDRFHSLISDQDLAQNQSMDTALAEWHAFGAFVFTRCLWMTYKDAHEISPILDSFRPALIDILGLNDHLSNLLISLASSREPEYMGQFGTVKDSASLYRFFSRVVAHITGNYSPDLDSQDLPQPADIALVAAISGYAMNVMKETTNALKSGALKNW